MDENHQSPRTCEILSSPFNSKTICSVILPTYNESKNISRVIRRIEKSLNNIDFELIIVDDNSPDNTATIVEHLNDDDCNNIRIIKRKNKLGLGSAILDGFCNATSNIFVVLDSDLQHPPEILPILLGEILDGADLVIASRYAKNAAIYGWSWKRKIVSKLATFLAHLLLPKTRKVKDLMSGFFMLKKSSFIGLEIDPISWKILPSLLINYPDIHVVEIPYVFKKRIYGNSNMSFSIALKYLIHIFFLFFYSCKKNSIKNIGTTIS